MKMLLPLSLLFLCGCPVEPKDVQDLNADGPGQMNKGGNNGGPNGMNGQNPGNNQGTQGGVNGNPNAGNMGGLPPGSPNMNGNEMSGTPGMNGPLPEGEQALGDPNIDPMNGVDGQVMNGGQGSPIQHADTIPSLPLGENAEANTMEGGQINGGPMENGEIPSHEGIQGLSGAVKTPEGTHPTPDFAHQPGEIPATAGDVLPIYQNPPQFEDFMGDEQISIDLIVEGAATFDFEFVVKREGDGRVYPKVLHKQANATSPVHILAPATLSEPVWLVITADKDGDGPTPDDLVGGSPEALTFSGKNMSLSYTLVADDAFMKNLPWFSQAQGAGGPDFQR